MGRGSGCWTQDGRIRISSRDAIRAACLPRLSRRLGDGAGSVGAVTVEVLPWSCRGVRWVVAAETLWWGGIGRSVVAVGYGAPVANARRAFSLGRAVTPRVLATGLGGACAAGEPDDGGWGGYDGGIMRFVLNFL